MNCGCKERREAIVGWVGRLQCEHGFHDWVSQEHKSPTRTFVRQYCARPDCSATRWIDEDFRH